MNGICNAGMELAIRTKDNGLIESMLWNISDVSIKNKSNIFMLLFIILSEITSGSEVRSGSETVHTTLSTLMAQK